MVWFLRLILSGNFPTWCAARIPEALKGVPFLTYENIFDVTQLPATMAVVGGGPIGAEIAQVGVPLSADLRATCRPQPCWPQEPYGTWW